MRMLLEGVKQAGDTIGLQELAVGAGCRNGTLERRTEQRVVIDDEDFVVHLLAAARFSQYPDFLRPSHCDLGFDQLRYDLRGRQKNDVRADSCRCCGAVRRAPRGRGRVAATPRSRPAAYDLSRMKH